MDTVRSIPGRTSRDACDQAASGDGHSSAADRTVGFGPVELLAVRLQGGSCCRGEHLSGLSPREREAFFHLVAGRTIRELAGVMNIRLKTAENYRCRVLHKIHARNAAEAVHYAVRHGLLVTGGSTPT